MTAIRITPPATLPVNLAIAKANMRVDGDDMDVLITSWIKGIVAVLEHEIGQCLIEQTWRVTLDCFPEAIKLPHPVLSITSVKYFDVNGTEKTLEPAAYRLCRARYQSHLMPARGGAWPATLADADVTVELVCGHGAAPADVPENVQLYILAKLVEQFDPATRLERDTVQSAFVERLLDACRSYT
jgi:uncharacterized phiE125 gp8 family phage protein